MNNAAVLPIGATITYVRTAPMTGAVSVETAVVEGRNWSADRVAAYIVNGGECVWAHQIQR